MYAWNLFWRVRQGFGLRNEWGKVWRRYRPIAVGHEFEFSRTATTRNLNIRYCIIYIICCRHLILCQGRIVPLLWFKIFETGSIIRFAHTSFKWANLASHNAGVTVQIIGLTTDHGRSARLFEAPDTDSSVEKSVTNINAYIVPGPNLYIHPQSKAPADRPDMSWTSWRK